MTSKFPLWKSPRTIYATVVRLDPTRSPTTLRCLTPAGEKARAPLRMAGHRRARLRLLGAFGAPIPLLPRAPRPPPLPAPPPWPALFPGRLRRSLARLLSVCLCAGVCRSGGAAAEPVRAGPVAAVWTGPPGCPGRPRESRLGAGQTTGDLRRNGAAGFRSRAMGAVSVDGMGRGLEGRKVCLCDDYLLAMMDANR